MTRTAAKAVQQRLQLKISLWSWLTESRFEPSRALLHPLWWCALAVLLLNDHYLKMSGHLAPWVTGKLSDFSGLFFAPMLLAALTRSRSRATLLLCHLGIGLLFAVLKLSGVARDFWQQLGRLFGLHFYIAPDSSDLLALLASVFSLLLLGKIASSPSRLRRAWARLAIGFAGTLGFVASVASTMLPRRTPLVNPDAVYVAGNDGVHVLEPATGAQRRLISIQGSYSPDSPEVFGRTLLFRTSSEHCVAGYNVNSGMWQWSIAVDSATQFVYASNTLFANIEGTLSAWDVTSGDLLWEKKPVVGLPASNGEVVVIGSDARYVLLGLSAKDGHELWRATVPGNIVSELELRGDRLIVLGTNAVHSFDAATGKLLGTSVPFFGAPGWADLPAFASPAVNVPPSLYSYPPRGWNIGSLHQSRPSACLALNAGWSLPRKELLALDPQTLRVLWNKPDHYGFATTSSAVLARHGQLVYALDDATGSRLWAKDISNDMWVGIGVGESQMVVQDDDVVQALDVRNGNEMWKWRLPVSTGR